MSRSEDQQTPQKPEENVQVVSPWDTKPETQQKPTSYPLQRAQSTQVRGKTAIDEFSKGSENAGQPNTAPENDRTVKRNMSITIGTTNTQLEEKGSMDGSESQAPVLVSEEDKSKLHAIKNTRIKHIKDVPQDDEQLKAIQQYLRNIRKDDPKILNPLLIGITGIVVLILCRIYL